MRKSQISVFVIIGIFLFISAVFFIYLNQSKKEDIIKTSFLSRLGFKSETDAIKSSVSECMKHETASALEKIGIQGGYYKKPEKYSDLGWTFIPYYYYKGEFLMPNKSVIENELSNYLDDKVPECLNQIYFKDVELKYENIKTKTSILRGKTVFNIDMPLSIIKGDKIVKIELKDYPVVYNSSLYDIIEVADFITKSHKENEKMVCVNCVSSLIKEKNLYVDFLNYPKDKSDVLVIISENYTSSKPYMFEFLNKY